MRFWGIFAVFAAAALSLFLTAYRSTKRPAGRMPLYIVAGALLLFAIGAGALVLYGLSGCSGAAAEGLIWDWLWISELLTLLAGSRWDADGERVDKVTVGGIGSDRFGWPSTLRVVPEPD